MFKIHSSCNETTSFQREREWDLVGALRAKGMIKTILLLFSPILNPVKVVLR